MLLDSTQQIFECWLPHDPGHCYDWTHAISPYLHCSSLPVTSLSTNDTSIHIVTHIRNPGIIFDSSFFLTTHFQWIPNPYHSISKHLWNLFISLQCPILVAATSVSQVDSCNSFNDLPAAKLDLLQSIPYAWCSLSHLTFLQWAPRLIREAGGPPGLLERQIALIFLCTWIPAQLLTCLLDLWQVT